MNGLALCAGIGGIELGIKSIIPQFRTVCYVEGEIYPASLMAAKMEEGTIPKAPIWSNVRTFDGKPWRGKVSIITGGFPCQPFSKSGHQKGENDPRELWNDISRIIGEVEPEWVFLENVPDLVKWRLPSILIDLAKMGFDAEWCVISANQCGALHERKRFFLLAKKSDLSYSGGIGRGQSDRIRTQSTLINKSGKERGIRKQWDKIKPPFHRMVDGIPYWVDRIRSLGNAVVPIQASYAFQILAERFDWGIEANLEPNGCLDITS